eukprot:TRINITY_DN63193_c0_g1_i1.p1 TRINITY_DN63193_c0_g1~~TRINITY_DN63193_c0_g1_i1.p1  ORF type:complete len:276 (-),score=64.61 TRINITY_DN63193_c0_g1_i1:16-843(-)
MEKKSCFAQWKLPNGPSYLTPSQEASISEEQERRARFTLSDLAFQLSRHCKLKKTTGPIAAAFLQRFFSAGPVWSSDPEKVPESQQPVVLAAVFLAGKVDECPVSVERIIGIWFEMNRIPHDESLMNAMRNAVLRDEMELLKTIRFELDLDLPYQHMVDYVNIFKDLIDQDTLKSIAQIAWNFINDAFYTTLCLVHPPHLIAVAAIQMTRLKECDVPPLDRLLDRLGMDAPKFSPVLNDMLNYYRLINTDLEVSEEKFETVRRLVASEKPSPPRE